MVSLYIEEEKDFADKCSQLVTIFKTEPTKFNQIFSCNLFPNMKPEKSLKIFKLFLKKSQLPYEMLHILGKCMQVVAQELGEFMNKDPREIDADTIVPYLIYVVVLAIKEVNDHAKKEIEETDN